MPQLIDFTNYNPETTRRPAVKKQALQEAPLNISDDSFKLTLNILVHNNPNKITFSLKEAAQQLNVGDEFLRRRLKSNKIKTIYIGDKPMIHIAELARILTEGIS